MFPRLDVDFHLAPFVDPRDHVGVATARVNIGAPHFEKPREFWVRPVRWVDRYNPGYANLLLRPIEAEEARLIIANFAFKHSWREEKLELPANWLEGRTNNHTGETRTLFSSCSRFWHEPEQNVRVAWQGCNNPVFCKEIVYPPDHPLRYLCFQPHSSAETRRFSLDEFVDWPTADFHNFLHQQLDNPNSQLYLTWKWSQLAQEERWRQFFALPRWNQLPILLKSILQNEAFHNPEIARFGAQTNFRSFDRHLQIRSSPFQTQNTTIRVRNWARVICCHFDKMETEATIPDLVYFESLGVLNVECAAPTHHEMLEARLRLHEWARQHLPPSQASELITLDDLN